MKSVIQQAADKGWVINAGTLQAQGLFHAVRNGAKTDDDVTVWCATKNEAAREALRMNKEMKNKKAQRHWLVYDPRDRQYISEFDGTTCAWSSQENKAHGFGTKAIAQEVARNCGYVPSQLLFTAREIRS